MRRNNIFLIGMMGSGKSTIGRLLADELGYEFVDMDSIIEEQEGRLIAEIFAHEGEEHFRRIESHVLAELFEKENCVIACGGGVVQQARNHMFLRGSRNVFYLDAKPQILYDRISGDESRPKLSTFEEFEKLYLERRKNYLRCSRRIIRADRNPIEVVHDIMRHL
ncbi:shikimate kinase [bacterium]|nr:shikimate kinase [bacterium]